MTQYNTSNVKLSNSQLNELKSRTKNDTQVTLIFWSNEIDNSSDFPHKLVLTDTRIKDL